MALLTVEDYEVASGGAELGDAAAAQCQYYIDAITSYLENKTGITFTKIVGAVVRVQADDYGEVLFEDYPVNLVTKIHDFLDDVDLDSPGDYWDGLQTVSTLSRRQVVDITYDYGMDPVPKDLQFVAMEAVKRGMASAPTGLKAKAVGDVIYTYGDMFSFNEHDMDIIKQYTESEHTIRLRANVRQRNTFGYFGLPVANGIDYIEDWCD